MFIEIMKVLAAMIFAGYVAYKTVLVGQAFGYEPKNTELTMAEYIAWKKMKRA